MKSGGDSTGKLGERIGLLENSEDLAERVADLIVIAHVNGEAVGEVLARGSVTVVEKDVGEFLPMIGARLDVERFQIRRTEKFGIDGQRHDWSTLAVISQFIQQDVIGNCGHIQWIEQIGCPGMPIIIAALRLRIADAGKLDIGIKRLIPAGTEEHSRLAGQMLLKQKTQSYGSAAAQ